MAGGFAEYDTKGLGHDWLNEEVRRLEYLPHPRGACLRRLVDESVQMRPTRKLGPRVGRGSYDVEFCRQPSLVDNAGHIGISIEGIPLAPYLGLQLACTRERMHAAAERPDPFDRYPGELETVRDVVSVTAPHADIGRIVRGDVSRLMWIVLRAAGERPEWPMVCSGTRRDRGSQGISAR
jgi:hypothetical protein